MTQQRVCIALVLVVALIIAGCVSANGTGQSNVEEVTRLSAPLWPIENGYFVMLSPPPPKQVFADYFRFVFDLGLLERAHETWLQERAAAGSGAASRPEEGLLRVLQACRIFRRAEDERAARVGPMIEVLQVDGLWMVAVVTSSDGRLRRQPVRVEDRVRIRKLLWPFFKDGEPIGDHFAVVWDEVAAFHEPVAVDRYRQAEAHFIVEWAGRKYKAAGVCMGTALAVPRLGPSAAGDFRPGRGDRHSWVAALVVIPSRDVALWSLGRRLQVLGTPDSAGGPQDDANP